MRRGGAKNDPAFMKKLGKYLNNADGDFDLAMRIALEHEQERAPIITRHSPEAQRFNAELREKQATRAEERRRAEERGKPPKHGSTSNPIRLDLGETE